MDSDGETREERNRTRRRVMTLMALCAVSGAALAGWREFDQVAAEQQPPPAAAAAGVPAADDAISARGRLEPKDGIFDVAGPSQTAIFVNVIAELKVKEGDHVEAGQVIAVLDTCRSKAAEVERLRAELAEAERQYQRVERLYKKGVESVAERDIRLTQVDVAKAELQRARADLELTQVHAPVSGQVLKIHAYPGERVGLNGIAEIGKTDEMYVVAEVYESDILRVKEGQRAVATNSALHRELHGTVEHIGWKIGKMDILETDPAAKTDARVVEVKIRLDDSAPVARLTNMQVEVRILPDHVAAG